MKKGEKMNYFGAKWWKFDFHVHSPASKDYGKELHELRNLTTRQWLLELMSKEIDCVALTDHNTGAWIDVVKAELQKMETENCVGYRQLFVFPGIEISVNGGIHLLGIFDLDKTSTDIAELIGDIQYDGTKGDSDGCTNKSLREVIKIISNRGGIAIPAHVDLDKGLFIAAHGTSLEGTLKEDSLLALEICQKEFEKPQIYKDLKLNLSEIIGSDSHKPETMGRRFTWVKMENPSLDALWLALHDGKDGVIRSDEISTNPNNVQGRFYIKRLIVKSGAKIGRGTPFVVDFSPWMTTVIGGRGSGKSSILNFLRLVFDQSESLTSALKSDFLEFNKITTGRNMPGMLLENTEIRAEVFKDGRNIALIRKNNEIFEEHFNESTHNWEDRGKSVTVSERFPFRIFSQKELYEITKNPKVLLNLVDSQFDKSKIDEDLKILKDNWEEIRKEERRILKSIEDKRHYQTLLDDIKAKMKLFEESDYNTIFEDYKKMKDVDNLLEHLYKNYQSINDNLNEKLNIVKDISIPEKLYSNVDEITRAQLHELVEATNFKAEQVVQSIRNYNQLVNLWTDRLNNLEWKKTKESIQQRYDSFVSSLGDTSEFDISTYTKLIESRKEIEFKLVEITQKENNYQERVKFSRDIYEQIIQNYKLLREQRKAVIDRWNSLSLNVKLSLSIMGDAYSAEEDFRRIIRKTDDRLKKDIYDINEDGVATGGFIFKLCDENRLNTGDIWEKRNSLINELCDYKNYSNYSYSKNFERHMERITLESPEDIDQLMFWAPDDQIKIKIVDGSREFDVEIGSAGQRTAAILSLILSLDDSPLIIDQPEDDLDTKRISDLVVTGLRKLKIKQQVIVVTHNPNIPVNGASEQIIQLRFTRGMIQKQTSGALQKKIVRKAVCDVMEGGKTALYNRYYRISKALE
ncbi:MAG: hypothetical protein K0R71_1800 [Bacillales bacterium]|jgi:energy-coupling factor transporter ATP-binding protein EcfA2|nr:hypothetical protein [Bacillales bacterium]